MPAEQPPAEPTTADPPAAEDAPADELPPCTEDHPATPDLTQLPPCQNQPDGEEPPPAQPVEVPSEELPAEESVPDEEAPADELLPEPPAAEEAPTRRVEPTPADPPAIPPPTDPSTDQESGEEPPPLDLHPEPAAPAAPGFPIELRTKGGDGLTIDLAALVPLAFTTLAHTAPTHGTLMVEGLVATYIPRPGFYGVDRFTLRVCDRSAVCHDILASVTVPPINDFLLTTGAAVAKFFSAGGSTLATYHHEDLLPAQRVAVPLAGLAALVGGSLLIGLESVGTVLRRLLAMLAIRS
jgi:hypothetical protein